MSQAGRFIAGSGAAPIEQITGNAGVAVPVGGNVDIVGATAQGISTSGAGDTLTITAADATETQKGVVELATNAETIAGTDTTRAIVPSALTAKLGTQTNHGILVGAGTAAAITALAAATNGQLPIGSAGADPVMATLTAGSGIAITNGAGSITITSTATGAAWNSIGASQTMAVDNGYICSSGGGLVLQLPATSALGDEIEVVLDGSTSWTVVQAAGQQIRFGNVTTTLGALGSLGSTAQGDAIRIVCKTANTLWIVLSSMGNITVV